MMSDNHQMSDRAILPNTYKLEQGCTLPLAYYQVGNLDLLVEAELRDWLDDRHRGEECAIFVKYGSRHEATAPTNSEWHQQFFIGEDKRSLLQKKVEAHRGMPLAWIYVLERKVDPFVIVNDKKCYGFVVTGEDRDGRRFSQTYSGSVPGWMHANCINKWKGSIWGLTEDGRRFLLQTTVN